MPYKITWKKNGAIRRLWGFVTEQDVRESFRELHHHPDFLGLSCLLHDVSEMTGRNWGKYELTLLGANHVGRTSQNPRLRDIFVSSDDEFVEMLKDSVVTKLLPNPVEYFRTLEEGMARYLEIVNGDLGAVE